MPPVFPAKMELPGLKTALKISTAPLPAPLVLLTTVTKLRFVATALPSSASAPPHLSEVLPARVTLVAVSVPLLLIPPPDPPCAPVMAVLLITALLKIVNVPPLLSIPPPFSRDALFEMVELLMVAVPL